MLPLELLPPVQLLSHAPWPGAREPSAPSVCGAAPPPSWGVPAPRGVRGAATPSSCSIHPNGRQRHTTDIMSPPRMSPPSSTCVLWWPSAVRPIILFGLLLLLGRGRCRWRLRSSFSRLLPGASTGPQTMDHTNISQHLHRQLALASMPPPCFKRQCGQARVVYCAPRVLHGGRRHSSISFSTAACATLASLSHLTFVCFLVVCGAAPPRS